MTEMNNFPEQSVFLLSFVGILGAFGVWMYQLNIYLHTGVWAPVSIITLLRWNDSRWAYYPTDWIGVHKIFDTIPLALASIAVGFALAFVQSLSNKSPSS